MKFTTTILLCLAAVASADEIYLNQIWQISQSETPGGDPTSELLTDLAPNGTTFSKDPVIVSSVFQLTTTHRTTGQEHLLDEKTVSGYHPQATITIVTKDPYEAIPRTRVDHPFTVEYTTSGIITDDPEAPAGAKGVNLERKVTAYGADQTQSNEDTTYSIVSQDTVSSNGEHDLSNVTTAIPSSDLTTVHGEEVFSIFTLDTREDEDGNEVFSQLDSATVQILPIASGSISGVTKGETYNQIPTLTISGVDLYPNSDTYLYFYKTDEPTVNGRIGNNKAEPIAPVTKVWTTSGLNAAITEDGGYTLELRHETVLDEAPIVLASTDIEVERGIEMKGSVISAE